MLEALAHKLFQNEPRLNSVAGGVLAGEGDFSALRQWRFQIAARSRAGNVQRKKLGTFGRSGSARDIHRLGPFAEVKNH